MKTKEKTLKAVFGNLGIVFKPHCYACFQTSLLTYNGIMQAHFIKSRLISIVVHLISSIIYFFFILVIMFSLNFNIPLKPNWFIPCSWFTNISVGTSSIVLRGGNWSCGSGSCQSRRKIMINSSCQINQLMERVRKSSTILICLQPV